MAACEFQFGGIAAFLGLIVGRLGLGLWRVLARWLRLRFHHLDNRRDPPLFIEQQHALDAVSEFHARRKLAGVEHSNEAQDAAAKSSVLDNVQLCFGFLHALCLGWRRFRSDGFIAGHWTSILRRTRAYTCLGTRMTRFLRTLHCFWRSVFSMIWTPRSFSYNAMMV